MTSRIVEIVETGKTTLEQVEKKLRNAGTKEVKNQLRKSLAAATKSSRMDLRNKEREGGYLPAKMRSKWTPIPSQVMSTAGDQIAVTWKQRKSKSDMQSLNRGRLRHPLFGNRRHWYSQAIKPGMWDESVKKVAPEAIAKVELTLEAWAEGEFRG